MTNFFKHFFKNRLKCFFEGVSFISKRFCVWLTFFVLDFVMCLGEKNGFRSWFTFKFIYPADGMWKIIYSFGVANGYSIVNIIKIYQVFDFFIKPIVFYFFVNFLVIWFLSIFIIFYELYFGSLLNIHVKDLNVEIPTPSDTSIVLDANKKLDKKCFNIFFSDYFVSRITKECEFMGLVKRPVSFNLNLLNDIPFWDFSNKILFENYAKEQEVFYQKVEEDFLINLQDSPMTRVEKPMGFNINPKDPASFNCHYVYDYDNNLVACKLNLVPQTSDKNPFLEPDPHARFVMCNNACYVLEDWVRPLASIELLYSRYPDILNDGKTWNDFLYDSWQHFFVNYLQNPSWYPINYDKAFDPVIFNRLRIIEKGLVELYWNAYWYDYIHYDIEKEAFSNRDFENVVNSKYYPQESSLVYYEQNLFKKTLQEEVELKLHVKAKLATLTLDEEIKARKELTYKQLIDIRIKVYDALKDDYVKIHPDLPIDVACRELRKIIATDNFCHPNSHSWFRGYDGVTHPMRGNNDFLCYLAAECCDSSHDSVLVFKCQEFKF